MGEGKVLKYTHSGTNTWQSPYLDLKTYAKNAMGTTPGRIYISFDIYSPDKNMKAFMCVRTNNSGTLSACTTNGYKRGPLYISSDIINAVEAPSSTIQITGGQWHRLEFVFDITQADLVSEVSDKWMICLDGISDASGNTFTNGDVIYMLR